MMKTFFAVAAIVVMAASSAQSQTAAAQVKTGSPAPTPAVIEQIKTDARNLDGLVQQLQKAMDPTGMTIAANAVQDAAQIELLAARINRATKNHPQGK